VDEGNTYERANAAYGALKAILQGGTYKEILEAIPQDAFPVVALWDESRASKHTCSAPNR
jgi:hypothetical protein